MSRGVQVRLLPYLTTQQDLVEHQQEVQVQKGKLAEATGAVASLQQQRKQAEAEYQHKNLGEVIHRIGLNGSASATQDGPKIG